MFKKTTGRNLFQFAFSGRINFAWNPHLWERPPTPFHFPGPSFQSISQHRLSYPPLYSAPEGLHSVAGILFAKSYNKSFAFCVLTYAFCANVFSLHHPGSGLERGLLQIGAGVFRRQSRCCESVSCSLSSLQCSISTGRIAHVGDTSWEVTVSVKNRKGKNTLWSNLILN